MNGYGLALFVHMIGLIALFGGFVILQQVGARFRAAITWYEARTWLSILRAVPGMLIGGGVFMLLSGLYMAHDRWSLGAPWVVVATVVVPLYAVFGIVVVARCLARLDHAVSGHEGPIFEPARSILTHTRLWPSIFAMNGGAFGVLWLMVSKPGWALSILTPLVLAAIGWFVGTMATHPHAPRMPRPRGVH